MKKAAISAFYGFGLLALIASGLVFWQAEGMPIGGASALAANMTAVAGIYYGLVGDLLIAGVLMIATGAIISFMTRNDAD